MNQENEDSRSWDVDHILYLYLEFYIITIVWSIASKHFLAFDFSRIWTSTRSEYTYVLEPILIIINLNIYNKSNNIF